MAKRRLMVEVDCGGKRCKRCAHVGCGPEPYCEPFEADCALDAKGRPLRLPACLAAELPAVPSADRTAEWRRLSRRCCTADVVGACVGSVAYALIEAADFVDALRRQHEPAHPPIASREVPADLSSMWGDVKCVPMTVTFEGKVKP